MEFENWINTTWGEVSELKYGKALKDYKRNTKGIPVFGTNGQIGYTDKYLARGPGIIIGRKGAYRGVHYSNKDFYVIDTAYFLNVNEKMIDIRWAYYELISQDINSLDSGSAIPSTRREDFYALKVKIPPLSIQKKIVEVLNAFDTKIDLNLQIVLSLKQLAQTLFKRWFVDFEFPNENGDPYKSSGGEMVESELGMIPAGWNIETLGSIASVGSGKRPKTKRDTISNEAQIPILGASKIMGYTNEELLNEPILVTGRVGTHGVLQRYNEPCWPSDNTLVLKSVYLEYVYQFMHNVNYASLNKGSTQPLITQSDIKSLKLALPTKEILTLFEIQNAKFTALITQNLKENAVLINLRDNLLPKLLSGEIELPEETEVTEDVPIS